MKEYDINTAPAEGLLSVSVEDISRINGEMLELSSTALTLNSTYNVPVVSSENVTVKSGTVIDAYYPAGIQVTAAGKTVTVENSTISCNSIRNAAILFGEDASWGDYFDGTVTFTGSQISLNSRTSNCIDAAGIIGNNLTVNFSGSADNSGGIRFVSTQGTGPANYASGIKALGNLTVNGTFGGEVRSYFDCTKLTSSRWAEVYGFQAAGNLVVNNNIAGVLAASAYTEDTQYDFLASRAYGLYSEKTLTVKGGISGTILALAETNIWGVYGIEGVNFTLTGTIYAGNSAKGETIDAFLSKLADPVSNKSTLLSRSSGEGIYSVYSREKSDVTFAAGSSVWGDVFLGGGSDFTVSSGAAVNGDVTLYGQSGKCNIEFVLENRSSDPVISGKLYDYNWGYNNFIIDATKALNGKYILADSFSSAAGVNITLKANGSSQSVTLRNDKNTYTLSNGMSVVLDNSSSQLAVTISGSSNVLADAVAPQLNGTPGVTVEDTTASFFWNAATDNVKVTGYQFRYGKSSSLTGEGVDLVANSYQLDDLSNGTYYFQVRAFDAAGNFSGWSAVQSFTVDYTPPVYLPFVVPQAEYMYGCTATVVGMLLGYYDRYGYCGYDMSNLIKGTVELNARGTDGDKYDMDAFDTVLGSAIASQEYVDRFYNKTAQHEYNYTFVNGTELNTDAWNCIADYLGTGQYWRGNGDLSTSHYYATLETVRSYEFTKKITGGSISVDVPAKYQDLLYGLDLYCKEAGYELDASLTRTVKTSNNGGDFDFEDYKAEIDAGRGVIISITGHSMLGYGYDAATNEIIFDDTYENGKRMEWGGSYYYSGANRSLESVTVVVFNTSSVPDIPPAAPQVWAGNTDWTKGPVDLFASFDEKSVLNQYSYDKKNWSTYTSGVRVDSNKTVYFRSRNSKGTYSTVTEYSVSNIDLSAPGVTVTGNESWTNGTVKLHVAANDAGSGVASVSYSFDNKSWNSCGGDGNVSVQNNGTVYIRVRDKVGNETVKSVEVACIDRTAPDVSVTENPVFWIKGAAELKVTATDSGSGVQSIFYMSGDGIWHDYSVTNKIFVSENGQVFVKVLDDAGNETSVSVEVKYLDNEAPELTLALNTLENVREVTVECTAKDLASGVAAVEYSRDGLTWQSGTSVKVNENVTVYFRGTDAVGNVSEVKSITISNIDDIPPAEPQITSDVSGPTKGNVIVSALFAADAAVREFSRDGVSWQEVTGGILMEDNGTLYFRSADALGNMSAVTEYVVDNIDRTPPAAPTVSADVTDWTNQKVVVEADFAEDSAEKEFSRDGESWENYSGGVVLEDNGTVYFRSTDAAGNVSDVTEYVVSNVDKSAPGTPGESAAVVSDSSVELSWETVSESEGSGVYGYMLRWGKTPDLSGEGEFFSSDSGSLTIEEGGRYYYQIRTVDKASNYSCWSELFTFDVAEVRQLQCSEEGTVSWVPSVSGTPSYVVDCGISGEEGYFRFAVSESSFDLFSAHPGTTQIKVRLEDSEIVTSGEIPEGEVEETPREFVSEANGGMDIFIARTDGTWRREFSAQHQGAFNGWSGTGEEVRLTGRNRICDIYGGSEDANILVLTDDSCGDALFIDDVFSARPESDSTARLARIDEIRAGAGNDVIDMTSSLIALENGGKSMKIHGGSGNDVIWGNSCPNTLFGDSGNDRLTGGSDNDIIVGGSGNDTMHGGGGEDIFTFCSDWGKDTVEQLEGGKVILWFAEGSEENWDEKKQRYSDGVNSVRVIGGAQVELRFGSCGELNVSGAFDPESTERNFQAEGKLA